MCGANPAAVKMYQDLADQEIPKLIDKGLAAELAQKVADSEKVLEDGDWEWAEDLAYDAWDLATDAVAEQNSTAELIAAAEEAMALPVTEVQPTVHAETEALAAKARQRAKLYA